MTEAMNARKYAIEMSHNHWLKTAAASSLKESTSKIVDIHDSERIDTAMNMKGAVSVEI